MIEILQNPHALAIIAVLEAAGLTVGDGEGKKSGAETVAPQVIVRMIPGGTIDGSVSNPEELADARFSLVAVGRVAAEARFTADKAAQALSGATFTVAGRTIRRVRPMEPWGRAEVDHDVSPPHFYSTRVFGMWSFPD